MFQITNKGMNNMPFKKAPCIVLMIIAYILIVTCSATLAEQIVKATYVAEDGSVLSAEFNNNNSTVTVNMPDGTSSLLNSAPSASGARFSDGSLTFWEHQGEATVTRDETPVFKGTASNDINTLSGLIKADTADIELFRSDAQEYIRWLKANDDRFSEANPTDPFECMIDMGEGLEPITATCSNVLSKALVNGDWASLIFELRALDEKYSNNAVMADGFLCFLMKKSPEGRWNGIEWFLGSDIPTIEPARAEKEGVSEEVLQSLEWTSELE